jgi:hypothetical protein
VPSQTELQPRTFGVPYPFSVVRDPLDDMPDQSRDYVVAEIRAAFGVDAETAEDLIRSAEPLWDAMERAGGLVDSWSGGEFCSVFPKVLTFIRNAANP